MKEYMYEAIGDAKGDDQAARVEEGKRTERKGNERKGEGKGNERKAKKGREGKGREWQGSGLMQERRSAGRLGCAVCCYGGMQSRKHTHTQTRTHTQTHGRTRAHAHAHMPHIDVLLCCIRGRLVFVFALIMLLLFV